MIITRQKYSLTKRTAPVKEKLTNTLVRAFSHCSTDSSENMDKICRIEYQGMHTLPSHAQTTGILRV